MFDPDNFYQILKSKYSWPQTGNLLLYFQHHGSKEISDLIPFFERDRYFDHFPTFGDHSASGKIILHDQEPFSFLDAAHTYRQYLLTTTNNLSCHANIHSLSPAQLLTFCFLSGLQPIFCHSELHSSDIKDLEEQCGAIECYYWYHAMIARDWFRHWHHHPETLPKNRAHAPYRFMFYAKGLDGSRAYRREFIARMSDNKQVLYQSGQDRDISSDHSAKIDPEHANLAAMHVVLETVFETSKIHLTEKVFKPMVMSQPFFILSGPGALGYLKDYGFQTFSDFWDESYDQIQDPCKRMALVEMEIQKITDMDHSQFSALYQSMLPVIEHNRRHFFSQDFQDYCIKEMQCNFSAALDLQWCNRFRYPGGTLAKLLSDVAEHDRFFEPYWPNELANFLNSKYLSVSQDLILQTYPVLSKYLG